MTKPAHLLRPAAPAKRSHKISSAGSMTAPRTIGNATTRGRYSTAKHSPSTATRPGADDALALPSRIDAELHYRNGTSTTFPTPKATTP